MKQLRLYFEKYISPAVPKTMLLLIVNCIESSKTLCTISRPLATCNQAGAANAAPAKHHILNTGCHCCQEEEAAVTACSDNCLSLTQSFKPCSVGKASSTIFHTFPGNPISMLLCHCSFPLGQCYGDVIGTSV